MRRSLSFISSLILAAACTQTGADAPRSDTAPASHFKLKVETLVAGLENPWGMAILPDDSALITEKPGRLRLFKNNYLNPPIEGVPKVLYESQGGLFDVALHPDFADNRLIYLSFAKGSTDDNATTLIRAKFDGKKLSDVKEIFQAKPHKAGAAHFGGRLLFLPDKTLLLTVGEGFDYKEEAQNPKSDFGKIIHLRDDGTVVEHNIKTDTGKTQKVPFYSYGHRNPQGLAYDKVNGTIYEHEHGPKGGDEINVLSAGNNYGWPKITYGVDYTGLPITDKTALPGMEQPLVYWVPSIAPSGMVFYDGSLFSQWRGDLIVSALAGHQLRRVDLESGKVVGEETLLTEMGKRFRNVATAPDGSLWVLTEEDAGSKLLRLTPK